MAKTPRVGDIFEIGLSSGKRAYGQYLRMSKMGPLIRVFDLVCEVDLPISQVIEAGPLFPPVITGLFAAIRDGMWKVKGNLPVTDFVEPKFVSALYDEDSGSVLRWSLWDGERFTVLGGALQAEYKKLEYLVVWNPVDVAERIETGEIPFPYGDLIGQNKFTPRPRK